ncbi:MAG: peptidoglycan-associated lipoprotein [Gallionellales bacterium RIFCSPHIGHO2_02_FULL_57_16]|nr:MAG: peptidoglycan-associated lipoprotein [Gallionellales bacterium RIFCSPHIGHO2_02_FULL_57_16]
MKKIAVVLFSLMFAACASNPKTDSSQAPQSSEASNKSPAAANAGTSRTNEPLSSTGLETTKSATEMQGMKQLNVYFDFDMYDIKPEYRNVIQQQASFIKKHKDANFTLEGNADERGSNEYNLALGEKRANSVLKYLELMGVSEMQIKTVSLGEEQPRLTCHEEECWKENRRTDFIYN